jgi:hypothetical protein
MWFSIFSTIDVDFLKKKGIDGTIAALAVPNGRHMAENVVHGRVLNHGKLKNSTAFKQTVWKELSR